MRASPGLIRKSWKLNRCYRSSLWPAWSSDYSSNCSLEGDKILEGSIYQTLLEARERKPDVPILRKRTADFSFLRYIGHPQMEVNTPLLDEWGSFLASELRHGSEIYVFCHSPDNLLAPWLCREFYMRIANQVNILPLPWDEIQANISSGTPILGLKMLSGPGIVGLFLANSLGRGVFPVTLFSFVHPVFALHKSHSSKLI